MSTLGIVTACLLPLAADDAGKKELEKFQGTWVTKKLEYNGKDVTEKYGIRLVFKGDVGTVKGNDAVQKEYARLQVKLDPSTTPRCVDMKILGGVQKDAVIEGIYELKGGELKICAKVIGNERPTKFDSPAGQSIVLLVLERKKD